MTDSRGQALNVAEAARRRMASLAPSERKVARALLAAYPVAGLETVAELARRAGVSAPTVMRFAAKLGYERYPDFQQALKDELLARASTPAAQISSRALRGGDPGLAWARQCLSDALGQTLEGLSPQDITGCAALLADTKRPVTALGGRFTSGLAEYFGGHLQQVRPGVRLVDGGPFGKLHNAVDMSKRDVLVAFDFRRYQQDTIEFARVARSRGASVILVTDPWLSPIAEVADFVLPAVTQAVSPFDTLVAAFALADVLVAAVIDRVGDLAERRVRYLDDLTALAAAPDAPL